MHGMLRQRRCSSEGLSKQFSDAQWECGIEAVNSVQHLSTDAPEQRRQGQCHASAVRLNCHASTFKLHCATSWSGDASTNST
jgi:hypothetical protein